MSESTDLVDIQEQLRKELAQLGNTVEPPSSNKVNLKGKVFALPDGKSGPGPLQVIILDYIATNKYYPGVYDAKKPEAPKCWAINKDLKAMGPSENVPEPQSKLCEPCPRNQWGTGIGGRGKSCKNQRRLLMITPEFGPSTEPLTMEVSPTGLKSWNNYLARDLAAGLNALPIQVITEISFDPYQAYPTLQFKYVEKHGRVAEAMAIRAKWGDLLTKEPDIREKK